MNKALQIRNLILNPLVCGKYGTPLETRLHISTDCVRLYPNISRQSLFFRLSH